MLSNKKQTSLSLSSAESETISLDAGLLCIFGSHTFVPSSWMCKKQTSVSHSSTEAEIISLDAGLRIDGIPALTHWDLVIEVFHSVPNRTDGPKREPWGNPSELWVGCLTGSSWIPKFKSVTFTLNNNSQTC